MGIKAGAKQRMYCGNTDVLIYGKLMPENLVCENQDLYPEEGVADEH